MVVDVVVQNPQKSNVYEYEEKHVRRDSKMCCCCCCRFCCGAPTTEERIHAPVLHDASQIAYCRYWGRASLPPIASIAIKYTHCVFISEEHRWKRGITFLLCVLNAPPELYHDICCTSEKTKWHVRMTDCQQKCILFSLVYVRTHLKEYKSHRQYGNVPWWVWSFYNSYSWYSRDQ